MIVKLLTEHHLEFLSLKGGCRGSSESTLVKIVNLLEISCHYLFTHNKFNGNGFSWWCLYDPVTIDIIPIWCTSVITRG